MSVYKRGDGRWQVLIDLERGVEGKRRRRALGTYPTRKKAEAAERAALEARDRGIDLSPCTATVADILAHFVAARRTKGCAVRTIERYEALARTGILPHLGTVSIARLTPAHVSSWLATLQERGGVKGGPLSPHTAKHNLVMLRSALRWAVRHDLAARNVAEAVDLPSLARSQGKALGNDEASRFLAAADATPWGTFFRVALGTGARRGELLTLRWSDVDFEAGMVTIARAVVEVGAGEARRVLEKSTKTDRVRSIPLGPMYSRHSAGRRPRRRRTSWRRAEPSPIVATSFKDRLAAGSHLVGRAGLQASVPAVQDWRLLARLAARFVSEAQRDPGTWRCGSGGGSESPVLDGKPHDVVTRAVA